MLHICYMCGFCCCCSFSSLGLFRVCECVCVREIQTRCFCFSLELAMTRQSHWLWSAATDCSFYFIEVWCLYHREDKVLGIGREHLKLKYLINSAQQMFSEDFVYVGFFFFVKRANLVDWERLNSLMLLHSAIHDSWFCFFFRWLVRYNELFYEPLVWFYPFN